VNTKLADFCSLRGILHETTVPYSPQSNGKIEREMRTVKDTARAMMQDQNVPEFLWAEAVASSVFIHNRILNKQSPNITAYEVIFGRKPQLGHLRVFGCLAYAHVPDQKRSVWQPKGRECILVGYDTSTSHYRLYDENTRSVFIERNVTFMEKEDQRNDAVIIETETVNKENFEKEHFSNGKIEDQQLDVPVQNEEIQEEIDPGANNTPHMKLRDRLTLKKPDRYQVHSIDSIMEPDHYKDAIASPQSKQWKEAMEEEYKSHLQNGTWTLVERPNNQKILDSRWIFKIKRNPDLSISRYKARLVVRGFRQQYGIDYDETYSSVCRYESIRLLLSYAAIKGLKILQIDVKTAFFVWKPDREDIYVSTRRFYEIK